ncbi:DNA mismatch repair protein MutL [Actinoplanes sp. NPDC049265]|uniref:DNA mismatch repair protein MutL n=1 Tax=Actinoplanes sp. NPDC049265 TaxID=3363902 RepID=UPI0037101321
MRSPRTWFPLLGWLAATLTSIVLASVAMLPVLRTATGDDGGLISADQLRRSGDRAPLPLPSVPSASPSSPAPATTTPPARATPDERADDGAKPDSTPTTTPPTSKPPKPPATKPTSPSRVVDGWTVTTDGGGVDTYTQAFRVDGGQAVVRIRSGKVQLVSATPNNGFEVAVVQDRPEDLAVYFNETNHSFIVHAVWNVDRPNVRIDEIGS